MSIKKAISQIKRSKQFAQLQDMNLQLVSTDKQLENGTLSFAGKVKKGRKTLKPTFQITVNGAVISNKFTARRVDGETYSAVYKAGLTAVADLLQKRLA